MGDVLRMPFLSDCHGAKLDDNSCIQRPAFVLLTSDGVQYLSCGRHLEWLLNLALQALEVVEVKAYNGN